MLRVQQLMSPHDRKHPKVLKYTRHIKIHQAGDVRQIRPARLTHVQPVDAPFDTRCGSADKFSKPMTAAVEGSVQAIHPISSLDRFLDLKLRSEIELTTVFFLLRPSPSRRAYYFTIVTSLRCFVSQGITPRQFCLVNGS